MIWPKLGRKDFGPYLPQIPKDADAVMTLMVGPMSLAFPKQFRAAGFKMPMLGGVTSAFGGEHWSGMVNINHRQGQETGNKGDVRSLDNTRTAPNPQDRDGRFRRGLGDAERLRDTVQETATALDPFERDEPDGTAGPTTPVRRELQGEPGLPDAAGAGEGDEPRGLRERGSDPRARGRITARRLPLNRTS